MKKLFFAFISALMLIGFTSCNQETSKAGIVGKWEIVSLVSQGYTVNQSDMDVIEVWEFTNDNQLIIRAKGQDDDGFGSLTATWTLENDVLKLSGDDYFRMAFFSEAKVTTLTSTTLVLDVNSNGWEMTRTYKRVK